MAERDLRRKLFWLIAIRVGISSLLLGSAVFVQLTSPGTFSSEPLFLLIGVTYALNILWALTLKWAERHRWIVDVQLACDALIVSGFIAASRRRRSICSRCTSGREYPRARERDRARGRARAAPDDSARGLPEHIAKRVSKGPAAAGRLPESGFNLEEHVEGLEKEYITQALVRAGGVQVKAAQRLGMSFPIFPGLREEIQPEMRTTSTDNLWRSRSDNVCQTRR